MDLNKRYKAKTKKRVVRFFVYYSFLALFLFFYNTMARYTAVVQDTTTVNVANWYVEVNGQDIQEGETLLSPISLVQESTSKTYNNKLAPGQTGYFDITINPVGTDVSIEYSLSFDTTHIPSDIVLTRYEVLQDSVNQNIQNNIITGNINLTQSSQPLSASDTKTLRIYWNWQDTENTSIPTGTEEYYILATVSLSQKIGS